MATSGQALIDLIEQCDTNTFSTTAAAGAAGVDDYGNAFDSDSVVLTDADGMTVCLDKATGSIATSAGFDTNGNPVAVGDTLVDIPGFGEICIPGKEDSIFNPGEALPEGADDVTLPDGSVIGAGDIVPDDVQIIFDGDETVCISKSSSSDPAETVFTAGEDLPADADPVEINGVSYGPGDTLPAGDYFVQFDPATNTTNCVPTTSARIDTSDPCRVRYFDSKTGDLINEHWKEELQSDCDDEVFTSLIVQGIADALAAAGYTDTPSGFAYISGYEAAALPAETWITLADTEVCVTNPSECRSATLHLDSRLGNINLNAQGGNDISVSITGSNGMNSPSLTASTRDLVPLVSPAGRYVDTANAASSTNNEKLDPGEEACFRFRLRVRLNQPFVLTGDADLDARAAITFDTMRYNWFWVLQ